MQEIFIEWILNPLINGGSVVGADWIILQFYKLFSYGDRKGTVEAFSLMPKHRLDQQLSDYIRSSSLEP